MFLLGEFRLQCFEEPFDSPGHPHRSLLKGQSRPALRLRGGKMKMKMNRERVGMGWGRGETSGEERVSKLRVCGVRNDRTIIVGCVNMKASHPWRASE